jgi:hypothetical protein
MACAGKTLQFLPLYIRKYPRTSFAAMNFCMIKQQRSGLQLAGTYMNPGKDTVVFLN